jgi:hypothetical protein
VKPAAVNLIAAIARFAAMQRGLLYEIQLPYGSVLAFEFLRVLVTRDWSHPRSVSLPESRKG